MPEQRDDPLVEVFAGAFGLMLVGAAIAAPSVGLGPVLVVSAAAFAAAAFARLLLPHD